MGNFLNARDTDNLIVVLRSGQSGSAFGIQISMFPIQIHLFNQRKNSFKYFSPISQIYEDVVAHILKLRSK